MKKPDRTISAEQQGSYWRLDNNMEFDYKRYVGDLEMYVKWLESSLHDQQKLYDWLIDDNRKPSQTYFAAGMTRIIAREIEYSLSKLNK